MAASTAFVPLSADQTEEGDATSIIYQVLQNVEFVTDVSSVLTTGEESATPSQEV